MFLYINTVYKHIVPNITYIMLVCYHYINTPIKITTGVFTVSFRL